MKHQAADSDPNDCPQNESVNPPEDHSDRIDDQTAQLGEVLATEERRANTYKLLAECFHPPDEELFALLEAVQRDDELDVAVPDVPAVLPEDREQLSVEHARLFVGPFEVPAPPYGSVYLDDEECVLTESTQDVRRRYLEVGLAVDLEEPADHVAAELEYCYVLVLEEVDAIVRGDVEAANDALERQLEFLRSHLGRWIEPFAEDVREHAECEFYRTLGDATAAFVVEDGQRLADRVERIEDGATRWWA